MPAGVTNPVGGYLAYCGIKAVGYTLAAPVISGLFERQDVNSFGVGIARTLIGMAAGALLFGIFSLVACFDPNPPAEGSLAVALKASLIVALVGIRIAEW
jgi:hypothetical protein